jgi:hypothetical protein
MFGKRFEDIQQLFLICNVVIGRIGIVTKNGLAALFEKGI